MYYLSIWIFYCFFFLLFFFFFNDTATTEIYTLSLHDALPISPARQAWPGPPARWVSIERATPPTGWSPSSRRRRPTRGLPGSSPTWSTTARTYLIDAGSPGRGQ